MNRICKLLLLTAAVLAAFSGVSYADATYSENWVQEADGSWTARDKNSNILMSVWFCDDAVEANGKDVWYLLDSKGRMVTAGLVQDATGNFYSLETDHNGYYGMLRYRSGTYDGIYLDLESSHEGSFAAIRNQDGIDALKEKYGLTQVTIGNGNIVYSSNEVRKKATTEGWATYANGTKYYYENRERVKGWKQIGESWYYFSRTSGAMLKSAWTPDGYYVDENGVWDGKAANASKATAETASKTAASAKTGTSSAASAKTGTSSAAATAGTGTAAAKTGSSGGISATGPGSSSTASGEEDEDDASGGPSSGSAAAVTDSSGQVSVKVRTVADPEWDAASVTKMKNYMTSARTVLTEAQNLYTEGKSLTAVRDKMKKYNKAVGRACGALNYFISLDVLLEERPALTVADGSSVSRLSERSQELLEDLGNLTLEEDMDLDGAAVTEEMEKIATVLDNAEKILALAGTM